MNNSLKLTRLTIATILKFKVKSIMLLVVLYLALAVCAVHSYRVVDLGSGKLHIMNVEADVTLERGSTNFNSLPYLLLARHPQFPLKRSLIKFESLDSSCSKDKITYAKMYLYYVYAHKASFHTVKQTPFLSHTIRVHRVKKSWSESQATSDYRSNGVKWSAPYLHLGVDAEDASQFPLTTLFAGRPAGFMEFDVRKAILDWKSGEQNYGLLLRVQNEQANGRDLRFASNAHADKKMHAKIHVMCNY